MLQIECSSSEGEYDEGEEEPIFSEFSCLFCESIFPTLPALTSHSSSLHGVDITNILGSLSFYDAVKLINYTRERRLSPEEFQVQSEVGDLEDSYMKPTLPNDSLLMVDFEDVYQVGPPGEDKGLEEKKGVTNCGTKGKERVAKQESKLQSKIDELEGRLREMTVMYMGLLEAGAGAGTGGNGGGAGGGKTDEDYFGSYSNFSIHSEMLQDAARTEAYRDFVYGNRDLFAGKRVLDVGCGTGILSLFAAKQGATAVVGVDNSDIVDKAKAIVRDNGLSDRINIIRGRMEDVNLEDTFDVVISEWMGYGMLFECMLDSVIIARDRYMKPTGTMIPNRASMFLAGISDQDAYTRKVGFWSDVYGFNMGTMKEEVVRTASVEYVPARSMVTTVTGFKDYDLNLVEVEGLEFVSQIEMRVVGREESDERDASPVPLTAFTLYFTCFFDGPDRAVTLDTAPTATHTHWQQTVLYLQEPLDVCTDDVIKGTISFRKSPENRRGYVIGVNVIAVRNEKTFTQIKHNYYLN